MSEAETHAGVVLMSCRRCQDPTPVAILNLYGARCEVCYAKFCAAPQLRRTTAGVRPARRPPAAQDAASLPPLPPLVPLPPPLPLPELAMPPLVPLPLPSARGASRTESEYQAMPPSDL